MQRKEGNERKKRTGLGPRFAFAALFVLAAAFYLSGGIRVYKPDSARRDEINQNVQRVYALENAPIVDLDEEARLKHRALLDARGGILVDDLGAEQARVLALEDWSKADFARWFSDAAIVGDSITISISNYKWLSAPPVFAKIGVRALEDLPLLDDVEAASPSVLFLCFGMNDMDNYGARVNIFINRYAKVIQRLKRNLPDAIIYINAVFPMTDGAIRKHSEYQYVDLYNEELQKMCKEQGVYFVDSGFILRQRPEFFEPDGVHMKSKFYPRWLTYLADISGLSNDEQ